MREQRKRKRKRSRRRRRRREEELADRPDLAPASDGGQRQRAEVRGQTSVIFLFFSTAGVSEPFGAVSKPCRRSEKKKKKRHSPDTGIRRVVPVPVSDTDTTPKMACPCNLDFNLWHLLHDNFSLSSGQDTNWI